MGALHQVNTQYYFDPGNNLDGAGHPGDQWGFAVGGGIKLNAPMIGHGDYFSAEVNYAEGASGYVFSPQISAFNWYGRHGDTAGYGILSDAVYGGNVAGLRAAYPAGTNTGLQLTTSLGRQRRLRAPLESAVEDVGVRRLCRSHLQRPGQCHPVHAGRRRQR